jgi:hypothetical protein
VFLLSFLRPCSASIDPFPQQGNIGLGNPRPFRRHDLVRVSRGDFLDEQTVGALARYDHWFSRVAALEDNGLAIEANARLLLLFAVTLIAVPLEDGTHGLAKINRRRRGITERPLCPTTKAGHQNKHLNAPIHAKSHFVLLEPVKRARNIRYDGDVRRPPEKPNLSAMMGASVFGGRADWRFWFDLEAVSGMLPRFGELLTLRRG